MYGKLIHRVAARSGFGSGSGRVAGAATRVLDAAMVSAGAMALAAAMAFGGVAHAQLPATQSAQGIQYVTGGFGIDESTALKEAKSRYPLALTFAATGDDGSTPYVAQVQLEIKDANGAAVLSLPSVGPYFLAELKPGAYTVQATYQGQTKTQKVNVTGPGSVDLRVAWPRAAGGPD